MVAIVVALAGTAAAIVVGAAVLQSSTEPEAAPAPQLPKGAPPLLLDLSVRDDADARALRRAAELYGRGRLRPAADAFARLDGVEADVGLALASWPHQTLPALVRLAEEHPASAFVRMELGLARFWRGQSARARQAWQQARRVEPDSLSAVRAGDLLHPNFPRGLPTFVPSAPTPDLEGLSPAQQLDRLRRDAARGGAREKLVYGVALQRLGRPISARRAYDAAVAAAPGSVESRVAAAVVRFDKADPSRAFARLGPLARSHPQAASVRFHLGLLLLWLGEVDEAKRQLRLARAAAPHPLATEAKRFLDRLASVGTS
jgi:tetratricopeptide (TPR) repeat protein